MHFAVGEPDPRHAFERPQRRPPNREVRVCRSRTERLTAIGDVFDIAEHLEIHLHDFSVAACKVVCKQLNDHGRRNGSVMAVAGVGCKSC